MTEQLAAIPSTQLANKGDESQEDRDVRCCATSCAAQILLVGTVAAMWVLLINRLRIDWSVNEQYSFGWAVPFLSLYLAIRGLSAASKRERPGSCIAARKGSRLKGGFDVGVSSSFLVLVFAAVWFELSRWIGEANSEWRLISWAMAMIVICYTYVAVKLAVEVKIAQALLFPSLFFLVAVPWPTPVEQPTIQVLTRLVVGTAAELLNSFGVAAIPHGSIIETAGGMVDVDEACSGIRSLQASLMVALFFGELKSFTVARRCTLCAIAVLIAFLCNLARTSWLSFAASQHGAAGVQRWHDSAGTLILVGCFAGVWLAAEVMKGRRRKTTDGGLRTHSNAEKLERVDTEIGKDDELRAAGYGQRTTNRSECGAHQRCTPGSAPIAIIAAAVILVLGEVGIFVWYRSAPATQVVNWTTAMPTNNPTYHEVTLPRLTLKTLRANVAQAGKWIEADGTRWQMFFFRWNPGRTAVHLARNHTPEVCLPASGRKLLAMSEVIVNAAGLSFPFRCYVTGEDQQRQYVFYSLWEDGSADQRVVTRFLDRSSRMDAVLHRRRNPGQRSMEIVISGTRDQVHAEEILRSQLPRLVKTLNAEKERDSGRGT